MKMMTFRDRLRATFDYDPETGVLTRLVRCGNQPAGSRAGSLKKDGYRNVRFEGVMYREHRIVFYWVEGRWPDPEVDHDNRKRDDNRWVNLLESDRLGNTANTGGWSAKPSGLPLGVHHSRNGTYIATVQRNKKQKYLGSFKTVEEASRVALEARA